MALTRAEADAQIRAALAHKRDAIAEALTHLAQAAESYEDADACDDVVDALLEVRLLTP